MPKVSGPTIPRWRLGEELSRLREGAGVTLSAVAAKLDCSDSKVSRIETGQTGVNQLELNAMLDLYGVTDEALRQSLLDLQRLGKQRGWWSEFKGIGASFGTFLSLESSATRIRVFEASVIHGLLQTEDYSRANALAWSGEIDPAEAEQQVRIRLRRQELVLNGDDTRSLWFVLDEATIRRLVGGPDVMRDQLLHLIELAQQPTLTLQVVPFEHGGYPGMSGSFTLFEFADDVHSPVVYVESPIGNLYAEKVADYARCSMAYEHISAGALSPTKSMDVIRSAAKEFE